MAERLERQRLEREGAERQRRSRIERERAERERAARERLDARRRERAERLRRERQALRRNPRRVKPAAPRPAQPEPAPPRAVTRPRPTARRRPGVSGPVRPTPRRGLFVPTAKAVLAVSIVLALSAALGDALGLPVPGLNPSSGRAHLANSADLFGVDQGTPTGLASGYVFPLNGAYNFGTKVDRFGAPRGSGIHEGQDILAKPGTPEVAVHDGIVVDRGKVTDPDSGGRGNYLTIYSPQDDHSFVYMHMLKPADVRLGDHVHAGELVGKVGCTGDCSGPHLHFEVRIGKATIGAKTKPIDPLPFLQQWPQPQG
jgi:murein DD-endopeptidase MepM/ murein hydrolase activator NlpD